GSGSFGDEALVAPFEFFELPFGFVASRLRVGKRTLMLLTKRCDALKCHLRHDTFNLVSLLVGTRAPRERGLIRVCALHERREDLELFRGCYERFVRFR